MASKSTPRLWGSAYKRFYRQRIETRYLRPIGAIQEVDTWQGEGFAVATLFCSLVEFLESCERGLNFRYVKKGDPPATVATFEYDQRGASTIFRDFLEKRAPFATLVPAGLTESFYRDVRCGLVHEARTKGGWLLSTKKSGGALIAQSPGQIVLFRNELVPALERYFVDYRARLLKNPDTQAAFIRKLDHLSQP